MKTVKLFLGAFSAALLMLGAGCAHCAKTEQGKKVQSVKELKVLTIGNSFANSAFQRLPKIVASDPSCKIRMERANIGGCSFERHWKEHLKAEKNPKYKPYGKKYTLRELLKKEKWDIVTIQQASPSSWKKETYQPYAGNIIKLVKELAPTAEIVIQQTWSYNAGDSRFAPGPWKINQAQMYEKLNECYAALAKQYNFRVIPTGLAVQNYRKALGGKLTEIDHKALKQLKQPALPANNDVVGKFLWRKDRKQNKSVLSCDWIHMNDDGKYLQGLVWYGILFGKDPMTVKYVPKGMKKEQAEILKKCAADAVKMYPQVKK